MTCAIARWFGFARPEQGDYREIGGPQRNERQGSEDNLGELLRSYHRFDVSPEILLRIL